MGRPFTLAIPERIETALVRRIYALPPAVRQRLAGKPVVRDGQALEPELQLLLRAQKLAGRGAAGFGPERRQGVERDARLAGGIQSIGETRDLTVAGAEEPRRARLYVPHALLTSTDDALLVFFHGGGFGAGSIATHDATCRRLAERAGVRVLSVDYRLAPEHPFPAAPQDCWAAYRWVLDHAGEVGADPARLAVGGDSAGGNLAAVTAIAAAREGLPLRFQLLVYPVVDLAADTRSRREFGEGFYLTSDAMTEATQHYLGDQPRRHPEASPLFADLPDGLAPAHVVTAGFDPLRDEGEAYGDKLREAGVTVTHERVPGHIHGFVNMIGIGETSRLAVDRIADALAGALREAHHPTAG